MAADARQSQTSNLKRICLNRPGTALLNTQPPRARPPKELEHFHHKNVNVNPRDLACKGSPSNTDHTFTDQIGTSKTLFSFFWQIFPEWPPRARPGPGQGTRESSLCGTELTAWGSSGLGGRCWAASASRARRGQRGPKDWQRGAMWEARERAARAEATARAGTHLASVKPDKGSLRT